MPKNLDNLDWDDLKVFIQAARAGNLSGAARRLRVDHSTVSRRIAHLEATLGRAVFDRQPSGLRLSTFGERLLEQVERVESAVIGLEERVASEDTDASGIVRFATMEGIASLYLASRLASFCDVQPSITLELVTSPQTVYVNRREADLFLSFFKPPGRGLVSELVGRFQLRIYASPKYLERHGTPSTSADLSSHSFVTYVPDLIQVDCVRWLDDVIENPAVSFQSSSMIAQMNAAAAGAGLVLLPEFAVGERSDLVPVLANSVGTSRELWLNLHNDVQYLPRVRAVANFLRSTFRGDPSMALEEAKSTKPIGLSSLPKPGGGPVQIRTSFDRRSIVRAS